MASLQLLQLVTRSVFFVERGKYSFIAKGFELAQNAGTQEKPERVK